MRVTNNIIYGQLADGISTGQEDLIKAQQRVSSGKKVATPSDDPSKTNNIMGYRAVVANIEQYERNISVSQVRLNDSEKILDSAVGILQRLRELAISQANGTLGASDRAKTASEVKQLFDATVGLSNTKMGYGYIFGGYSTDTPPFDSNGNIIVPVTSISKEMNIQVDSNTSVAVNIPGDRLFKGSVNGVPQPGLRDIFADINTFLTALNTNNVANITATIGNLDTDIAQVLNETAILGAKQSRVETSQNLLADLKINTKDFLSKDEDIDIGKAISDFTSKQQALEAARSSSGKVLNMPTLMDFLK